MEHTGHHSVDGVGAYKQTSEKLKELPSSVLNQTSTKKAKTKCDAEVVLPGAVKLDVADLQSENVEPSS